MFKNCLMSVTCILYILFIDLKTIKMIFINNFCIKYYKDYPTLFDMYYWTQC